MPALQDSDEYRAAINIIDQKFKEKKEEWSKHKDGSINAEKFYKSIKIIDEFNYTLLNKYIKEEDWDTFIRYYTNAQFTLKIEQRKEIQKKIKNKGISIPLINNNIIKDDIHSIKEIFYIVCNSIIQISDDIISNGNFLTVLKNVFLENNIYSENEFKSSIPVKFGNINLKYNKLIFEVVDFFYKSPMNIEIKDSKEINLMKSKATRFKSFEIFFSKFHLFNDDNELFEICDYLLTSIYILFDVDKKNRNYDFFKNIIICCLPFEFENAKKIISKLKKLYIEFSIIIDGKNIKQFDINTLKPDSKIYFGNKDFEISINDVNWNLDIDDFINLLDSDKFMFCFRFPKLSKINYLYIKKEIRDNYRILFKKIIKSEIMKQAMNLDGDAKKFKYPFNNDKILNEIEKNSYLVPFPANNFYGISDRVTFSIYLNSFIDSNNFKTIFIDIDNITKSRLHEIKHIYRLYFNIYKPEIQVKTPPNISAKGLYNNALTKNNYSEFRKKMQIMDYIYTKKCVPKNESKKLDYGDILEYAINGNKQDVFFIKNSLFCLTEASWNLPINDFMQQYFQTCFDTEFFFGKKINNNFINSIINYFKLETNINSVNEANTSKRASRNEPNLIKYTNITNSFYYKPRQSHFH